MQRARLLIDGTLDGSFQPGTVINNAVRTLALDASGNVLIGGFFTQVGSMTRNRLARLINTGAFDMSYGDLAGASSIVSAVVLAPNGQVLVGGVFP